VIQRQLQNPLANLILEGVVGDNETVNVSATEGGLTINDRLIEAA
jgi:ATP-dependent Clp protease ATP-binding subunit ClpB